ncbi:MAG: hypothetical protein Q8M65_00475 [Rhodoglobus sp.]|nr:hypothetical protein [Rhodoglobus sp.]
MTPVGFVPSLSIDWKSAVGILQRCVASSWVMCCSLIPWNALAVLNELEGEHDTPTAAAATLAWAQGGTVIEVGRDGRLRRTVR